MAWSGTAEERIAIVRRLFDATDDQQLADVYADDLRWSMPKGRGVLMGERRGRTAIDEAFAHVLEVASEYHTRTEPWEILSDGTDTISFNRDWGRRRSDGAEFDFEVAMRWEFHDGRITAMYEYIQDEEHKGAFF